MQVVRNFPQAGQGVYLPCTRYDRELLGLLAALPDVTAACRSRVAAPGAEVVIVAMRRRERWRAGPGRAEGMTRIERFQAHGTILVSALDDLAPAQARDRVGDLDADLIAWPNRPEI